MRYNIIFQSCHFGYISGLWCLKVQERYEDTDLEHIHELFVESLVCKILEAQLVVIENLDLVLLDQK